jgi:hypothetical protein
MQGQGNVGFCSSALQGLTIGGVKAAQAETKSKKTGNAS